MCMCYACNEEEKQRSGTEWDGRGVEAAETQHTIAMGRRLYQIR